MTDLVQLTKDNDIAVITINNPPVNALSPGVPEGISEALDKQVCDRVSEFHRQHGEIWRPAPLLKGLADEGKRFADFGKEEGAAA
jgi:hypothetical protein